MYATLNYDARGGFLTCRCEGVPYDCAVTYRLMRHGTVVDEYGPTSATSHQWIAAPLSRNSADYHAVVSVGDEVLETEWQFVPSADDKAAFANWLDEPLTETRIDLPAIAPTNRPYEAVAFVWPQRGVAVEPSLWNLATASDASVYALKAEPRVLRRPDPDLARGGLPFVLSTAHPVRVSSVGGIGFGSGFAFDHGTLRRSSEVVRALSLVSREPGREGGSPHFASDQCGDFAAAVLRSDHGTEFHTDYLGVSAWFEYESERIRVVASSYLLAVRIAEAFGEVLSLNLDTIDADLTSLTQPFQQPILDELELSGFSCVPPNVVVSVRPDGTRTTHLSTLGEDLRSPERLTVARYNELIDMAADELRLNCAAIMTDPSIVTVRCDITGGLDSRLVLAGLRATQSSQQKIVLYTEPSEGAPSPDDERIALLVAEHTGLSFSDEYPTNLGECRVEHLAAQHVAATFGVYWHRPHQHACVWDASKVYVGGAGLGNVARDYSTDGWQLTTAKVASIDEVSLNLARQVFKWRGRATLKAAPAKGIRNIARSWDCVPGDETEKGSQLFNSHRARFHGGGAIPAALGTWRMSPGATRSLHLLRLMAGPLMAGPRVQIDLIHRLDPGLAAIPYGRDSYNHAYSAVHGDLREDLVGDATALAEARERAAAGLDWHSCETCDEPASSPADQRTLADLTLQSLRELGRDPSLHEIILPAHRFAIEHLGSTFPMEHSYSRTFVNKVLHLHAMWHLSAESRRKAALAKGRGPLGLLSRLWPRAR